MCVELTTNRGLNGTRRRTLWGLHKSGHIFPIYIRVSQISGKGPTRAIFMAHCGRKDDQCMYFFARDGFFKVWSADCGRTFNALNAFDKNVSL